MTTPLQRPDDGVPMCTYRVVHETHGPCAPRPCKRAARPGERFCALHARVAARHAPVSVTDGGFCVVCVRAARSYRLGDITISLCDEHGKALARAIRYGR